MAASFRLFSGMSTSPTPRPKTILASTPRQVHHGSVIPDRGLTMTTKAKLSDAIRRGMERNQERGLPINRWSQSRKLKPQLSRFDERFLELYEKGHSEREMTRILKVGRGTIHRTKLLLGLVKRPR